MLVFVLSLSLTSFFILFSMLAWLFLIFELNEWNGNVFQILFSKTKQKSLFIYLHLNK